MAERKGSVRFESEPHSTKGDRNSSAPPEIESGLARAAADRWRQADGRLSDSVAHVTQRQPITHADLFPADARPSRLRMALYGTVAAVSLIAGGSVLALLFMPGGESVAPVEQQVASVEPAVNATMETASDASPDAAPVRASGTETPAPQAPATPSPLPAPSNPAVDATTTGTAPQARWMERWTADAAPEAQSAAPADDDAELADALRESLPPPAASQPVAASQAPAPVTAAPEHPAAPAMRVIDTGPADDETETAPLPAPTRVEPPPVVATAPAAPPPAPSVAAPVEPEPAPASTAADSEPPAPAADELVAAPAPVSEPQPPADAPAQATETASLPPPQGGRSGRIVSPVNLRASGERGAAILGTVAGGSAIQVIACELWCEVVTPDGRRGFVFKDFVSTSQ
ncbi:hypothetical protein [Antarcticirhabdus aurantiaca]|uniref:Uncharacterized protein n=1 Tax=Antarcticirhabdus aurantiaca TaxID=2606717 RepID=A0ACD4NIZ1_9HYPH|nr:hypothetical protein [Antarcticirhabdus aurantiaca]WAJ26802.1 hypothetical protein OXU80_18290 [Jeongeuplla avenae]